uniref:Porphobilinogen deaminase, chloroplastic n=2 Tax=Euglena gracilis TaxID=3039 RepID=HEM3_EUGGR|nr:RecName: Full=Porphobilinogen deaminase, chloroplastic; Short=PBG; AltName: Full=Hydroxymethylbilane synthase; Short=HMBS; AltName: Full=Pre-uroporphyrinogen synthase; Flags: Precursor [Euglena gracilis]CAA33759.1 unnamed protein product [Euglena gracilis]
MYCGRYETIGETRGNSLNVFIGAAAGFVAAVALINSGLATSFYSTPVRAVPQVIVPSSLAASSQLPVVPKETNIQVNSAQILYPDSTVKGQERTITILGVCSFLSASLFYIWKQFGMKARTTKPADLQEVSGGRIWSLASTTGSNIGAGKTVRVATRKSPLAMWQAEFIQSELERLWPGITVELQPMSTRGDKILDSPLAKVGGKGLFVKELETALLENRSDIAVHSTKDVPMELPEGLVLGVICKRHDPCDAIVFPKGSNLKSLEDLPHGARVGTSSLRRQCQLLLKRPDLKFLELRGNVNTRLAKLDSGDYDAIILAAAGLKRLGFSDRVLPGETNIIDPNVMCPAAGQGALSIELRTNDPEIAALLEPLHHIPDAVTVACERAMNRRLNGGCQVPISGFAQLKDGQLRMEARVGSVTGKGPLIIQSKTFRLPWSGRTWPQLQKESEALGVEVADMLLADGAQAYLDEAYASRTLGWA